MPPLPKDFWDALSAVGSVAALTWAVYLSYQQGNEQRRREAALVKAILITIEVGHSSAKELNERLNRDFWLEDGTAPLLGEARAAKVAEYANDGGADWARQALVMTNERLDEIHLSSIPSAKLITDIVSLTVSLRRAVTLIDDLIGEGANPGALMSELNFLHLRVELILKSAKEFGIRSLDEDPELLRRYLPRQYGLRQLLLVIASPFTIAYAALARRNTS